MNQLSTLAGAARYEFRMQIRRWSMWVIDLALGLIMARILASLLSHVEHGVSPHDAVLYWVTSVQIFLPLGFGVMLADRLVRDQRLRTQELFVTTPSPDGARLLGKYFGCMLATGTPLALIYFGGVAAIAVKLHAPGALALGVGTFAAVVVPGLVFVGAFSLACPLVMPVPVYQFLFIGYWFWGNLLNPGFGIPTLSETVLTPLGHYRAFGFFGSPAGTSPRGLRFTPTLASAIASTLLMLVVPVLPLVAAWGLQRWRLARA
jgi:hypothetical protein